MGFDALNEFCVAGRRKDIVFFLELRLPNDQIAGTNLVALRRNLFGYLAVFDRSLSGDIAEEETQFLGSLRFKGKRPTPLYYYRALQILRDPLHFRDE